MTAYTVFQKRTVINLFAAILLTATTACSGSAGKMVTDSQLAQFQPGKTSYEQVVSALGSPDTTIKKSDGSFTAIYTYYAVTTRPETFIPVVGPFVGGADTKGHSVQIKFNPNGILADIESTDTTIATSTR